MDGNTSTPSDFHVSMLYTKSPYNDRKTIMTCAGPQFHPFQIFTPTPMLGYGYDVSEFWRTIRTSPPAAIILDSGSTDPGPYLLGTGKTLCSKQSYVRDLEPILEACFIYGTRLLIGSAGGAGTNAQVDILVNLIHDITKLKNYHFKLATIKYNDDREATISKFHKGEIEPCSSSPALQLQDIQDAVAVVAQMGVEPFLEVLKDSAVDIIVAGRSYDPSPFAAFCMHQGVEASSAWHVGKIIECGGLCAIPKGRSIVATMFQDSFILTPTDPEQRCTPVSVAAHTLYEKSRPDRLPGPGGVLYLDGCTYVQQPDGRSLLVKGSKFVATPTYQIKLEGAQILGYRSIFIGGIRDPILIAGIDGFLDTVRATIKQAFPEFATEGGPQVLFHMYGKNAVMGDMEAEEITSHELGVLGEIVADTQETADAIAGFARTVMLHGSYKGQLATAGNFASPLTPLDTSIGPVFKFSVYHLMEVDDPMKPFPIAYSSIGGDHARRGNHARPKGSLKAIMAHTVASSAQIHPPSSLRGVKTHRGQLALQDMARVIRSKNSGPFEVTLDILFETYADFVHARDSGVLCPKRIQRLYRLRSLDDIVTCTFFEPALAWKCTFKRYQAQGSVGERDTFGAQLHAPLLKTSIPSVPLARL